MQNMIDAFEVLLPEAILVFKNRYTLLQVVLEEGPIGRRGLVGRLGLSERLIRKEIEQLAESELVQISAVGIAITDQGKEVLSTLYPALHALEKASRLESDLTKLLNLKKVIVVKGDSDQDDGVKNTLGVACSSLLEQVLKDHDTLAITGGTTMSKMVEYMPSIAKNFEDIHVIPARGSVGARAEFQASTIAVELAKKLGAGYELLAIPDNLSDSSISLIKNEPHVQKILQKLAKTDIIIFGIGDAIKMAERRHESEEVIKLLREKHAVAESFRHYFDRDGQVIYASASIGMAPDIAQTIPMRIAVVGGASKADAILAMGNLLKDSYLIIDEGAAHKILATDFLYHGKND